MNYGWQDKAHEWESLGKIVIPDLVHSVEHPIELLQCENCNAVMFRAPPGPDVPEMVTPYCNIRTIQDFFDEPNTDR